MVICHKCNKKVNWRDNGFILCKKCKKEYCFVCGDMVYYLHRINFENNIIKIDNSQYRHIYYMIRDYYDPWYDYIKNKKNFIFTECLKCFEK